MVGVPHSKGCDACKRQKKRCKGSTAPCDRCKRLEIQCSGFGVQRYTFKDETVRLAGPIRETQKAVALRSHDPPSCLRFAFSKEVAGGQIGQRTSEQDEALEQYAWETRRAATPGRDLFALSKLPTSRLDRIISTLSASIDITVGSRIGLLYNFGAFLEDLPCRLGTNEALDAATEAMLLAYQSFKARKTLAQPSDRRAAAAYSRALRAMRRALGDVQTAATSETLCATMVLLMCETLNGPKENWAGNILTHAGGAASIIKARGHKYSSDRLEEKVLWSLRGPLIIQALLQKEQKFSTQEWHDLVASGLEGDVVDSRIMQTMAKLPNLLHTVQQAYSMDPIDEACLAFVTTELEGVRNLHVVDREEVVERFNDFEQRCGMHPLLMPPELSVLHSHFCRQVCIAYATEIYVHLILSGSSRRAHFRPSVAHLVDEHLLAADACAQEILALADKSEPHRPLGAVHMVFVMTTALTGALTDDLRDNLTRRMKTFVEDIYGDSHSADLKHIRTLRDHLTSRNMTAWGLEAGFIYEVATDGC